MGAAALAIGAGALAIGAAALSIGAGASAGAISALAGGSWAPPPAQAAAKLASEVNKRDESFMRWVS